MAKKKPPLSIFIACEGTNTEFLYLGKLNEVMEDTDHYPYAITIYPDRTKDSDQNPKTDAIGLVKVAIERKKDYDEAWVVFDKDGYTKHPEAFDLANENNIHIAFSSIAIEEWILLHFERNLYPFLKSADIIRERFHNNSRYLPDYAKKGEYNVYPHIIKKTEKAFENAAFLKWHQEATFPDLIIHERNPYTDVDNLIKKISLVDCVHKYTPVNQQINLNGIGFVIIAENQELVLQITNSTDRSYVVNGIFCL